MPRTGESREACKRLGNQENSTLVRTESRVDLA
jgi:hypothetical protein